MRLLVTGGAGQLGQALVRRGVAGGHAVSAPDRASLDVTDPAAIAAALDRLRPDAVVNAAAFTGVDAAEDAPAAAFAVNAEGAGQVARAAAARGVAVLHVSTDYVFDGRATRPYREDDPVGPLGVYGRSKADGEAQVRAAGGLVVRTSWLFGAGGTGFVPAIVRAARAGGPVRVVADRHGRPTWADHLADALLALAAGGPRTGVLHVAGDEPTTWYGLACAIVDELVAHGVARVAVEPITAAERADRAPRPAGAVLDTGAAAALGLPARPWRAGLPAVVSSLLR